ncbi:MAG: hypothetical protein C0514_04585 [Candidatus Puniceispirillum sp.]|nr:hypothetical protein [Candidatus Puniceispirillum sp.]
MSTAQSKKYLFETSFAAEDIAYRQSFHSPEEMEAAKASSYAMGFQAAQEDFEARNHAQLLRLEEKFADLFVAQETLHATLHHWISALCQEAFGRAFPTYARRAQFDEIETVLEVAIAKAKPEKVFTIRVAEGLSQGLAQKFTKWQEQGIEITLHEDPGLAPTDCQIAWADSGFERVERAIYEEIDRVLGSMLSYDVLETALPALEAEPPQEGVPEAACAAPDLSKNEGEAP